MPINKVLDKNGKPVKKDGKQKYRVRINYIDNFGKAKQLERTAYGLDESKQLEQELIYSVKHENVSAKLTLKKLYDEYVEAKKHEIRETSLRKFKSIVTIHILPTFEKTKIDKLNVQNLQQWKQSIEEKGFTLNTRKTIFKQFRALMNYAVKMEYLPKNPLDRIGNFKAPLEDCKEMDFYTSDEFRLFIKAAKDNAEKSVIDISAWSYYVFFCIAFYTGMRKGEIYALTWNDIQDGEINITKSLTQKLKGEDRITPPKNRSSIRRIQIPEPLQNVLDEHKGRCSKLDGFTEDLYICGGLRAIRDSSVSNMNVKFAEQSGVKKIRIHDFRHSHASLLANNGINIQEIARRLGHSDISITLKTYSHLYPKESERALTVLNEIKLG